MARKRRTQEEPEPKPDMTPMIDIVFNLIIFFMIVSELSQLTVEPLTLPYAKEAKDPKDKGAGPVIRVLQVNIVDKGLIKVNGQPFTDDAKLKGPGVGSFKDFVRVEAAGYDREAPDPKTGIRPSKMRINIRADKDCRFRFVQAVFDACIAHGVYKTSLAATKQEPGAAQ